VAAFAGSDGDTAICAEQAADLSGYAPAGVLIVSGS
jgi:hypothetical protein